MPAKKCLNCGAKVPKTTREPNAYNKFVKGAMQREDIKKLNPKEKMKAVAILWKRQSTAAKTD